MRNNDREGHPPVARPRTSEIGGFAHLSLMIVLIAASMAGFGIWGVMRHWNHSVQTQLRLDHCVGSEAMELKAMLNRIESKNTQIKLARAAAASAAIAQQLPLQKAAVVAGNVAAKLQDLELGRSRLRQVQWMAKRGCGERGDLGLPIPSMGWLPRRPPDSFGPQVLEWTPSQPQRLRIAARHSPLAAAAVVETAPGDVNAQLAEKRWTAAWTRFFWPSLD